MLNALKKKIVTKIKTTSDAILVTEEEEKTRFLICQSCDKLNRMNFCKMCGCYMPAKTKLAYTSCPLKKWMPIEKLES